MKKKYIVLPTFKDHVLLTAVLAKNSKFGQSFKG